MLPKIKYPIFEMVVPSTQNKIKYRQMLVQDEKILLVAKTSEDDADIFRAVKQVVNNCLVDDIDIDDLTTFDIEYMFIKIRAVSIGNIIEVSFNDHDDAKEYKFIVDLDEIEVIFPENISNVIKIGENSSVVMRYPPASLFDNRNALLEDIDGYLYLASKSIKSIFDKDVMYEASDYNEQELIDFVQTLDTKSYTDIKTFLTNVPRLSYKMEYVNSEGVKRELVLNTLTDFFTFW